MTLQAKRFSKPALQPVPFNGSAMFLRDAQPNPRRVESVQRDEHQQDTIRPLALQSVNTFEVAATTYAIVSGKAGLGHVVF